MEDNYVRDLKTLIDEHKSIQERNLKLAECLNAKAGEINKLRESEFQLQRQIRELLDSTVNLENISGNYIDLKDKYEKVIYEKKTLEGVFMKKERELEEQHQKQIKFYQELLAKEQENFKFKESNYLNEITKTSTALTEKIQEVEQKWRMSLEDANRKLKDSNLSCSTLRTQLVQANQRQINVDYMEKKLRELESKLEAKENELKVAQQALCVKENYKIPNSPPRDLYRTYNRRGSYIISKKSPNLGVGEDGYVRNNNDLLNTSNSSGVMKNYLQSSSEPTLEKSLWNNNLKNELGAHNMVASPPVKDLPPKLKKRKLYDPSAHTDFMCGDPKANK